MSRETKGEVLGAFLLIYTKCGHCDEMHWSVVEPGSKIATPLSEFIKKRGIILP